MEKQVEQSTTPKAQQTGKRFRVWTIIGIVLSALLLPILVINITLIIRSYTHKDEVPSIGGIFPLIVLTDSMYPQIHSGDLIICRQVAPEDIRVGDVIAFFDPAGSGTSIVTHRVVEITEEAGQLAFRTRGDANNVDDRLAVRGDKVTGVYRGRIPKAGTVAMFMQTTVGLILCVGVPLVLLVGYDLIRSSRFERQRKQDNAALLQELEALRAMQAAKAAEGGAPPAEAPPADVEQKGGGDLS